jgi:Mg2+/Co2+ transporter CorB
METIIHFVLLILGLLLCSAFFSAAETAITGASQAKIHKLKLEGNKRAKLVSSLREHKEKLIGVLLIGNNAVNILSSSIATSTAISLFGDEGVVYATVMMTVLIVFFAEVLPKTYAFDNSEKVALATAPLLSFSVKILYPFVTLIQIAVNYTLKIFNLKDQQKGSPFIDASEELRGAIELHHHEGAFVKHHKDMLGSILDLGDTEIGEIMIHRTQMITVNIETKPSEIIKLILESSHTRIPLWKDEPDNIVGVIHIRDLLRLIRNSSDMDKIDIMSIASDPWFIPDSTLLYEQLHQFRKRRNHFALVIDEYGALKGMVTLEDILEEIVGKIEDEHDFANNEIQKNTDGSYNVFGTVTIRDLNREFEWNLPDENANTIAGLLMHETEKIPDEGEVFEFYNIQFEILKKSQNQIELIRLKKLD